MILIRADANPRIGMGHIMRCLSLADAMRAAGQETLFILADNQIGEYIQSRGYQVFVLHSCYDRMEEELHLWPNLPCNCIIVDSYFVTEKYLNALRGKGQVIYIDDLASFPYPVDVLVNYNAYGLYTDYKQLYNGYDEPEYILGPAYVPLRTIFRGVERKKQLKNIRNVLISTGGSDELHVAISVITNMMKDPVEDVTYHFLIGMMNQDKKQIYYLAKGRRNIVLHENVADMRGLIEKMDLAVSAAGSTLYEICACGVPLITYVLADNQSPGAEAFEKLGLAYNLGDMREADDPGKAILSSIGNLAKNYERRVFVGQKMQSMIDGFGANRIVDKILEYFRLRSNFP